MTDKPKTGPGSGKGGKRRGAGRPKNARTISAKAKEAMETLKNEGLDSLAEMVKEYQDAGVEMRRLRDEGGSVVQQVELRKLRAQILNNLAPFQYQKQGLVKQEASLDVQEKKPIAITLTSRKDKTKE